MPRPKHTILFSGMIAGDPGQGGAAWAVLQYLLGLRKLGHEVTFVEPIKPQKLRPLGAPLAQSDNAVYFRAVMNEFGFDGASALLLAGTQQTLGLGYQDLRRIAARCD